MLLLCTNSMRFSQPAVASVPPGINANTMSLSVLGEYFFQPRCILPIGAMCKSSDDSKGTSKVAGKKESRTLREVAGVARQGDRYVVR